MERKWWTLIAVCVGTFMLLLDVTIVNVALPAIQRSLNASFSDLQWVVDAYALMLAALLLTTGSFADLFGRRQVFVIGLVIFTAGSLASGLAQSPLWLNLARGAQGIGGAAMFSTSLALLGHSFRGRERGTAFGVWGAITGVAVAIGPVIGGALTSGISWRWIFLVNVPVGIVAVAVTLMRVEESRMWHASRLDPIGVVTFSGALGALVYALIKGNSLGWGSTTILACLIGAGVLLVAFLVAEVVQGDGAMFDLRLFRKPTFTGGAIAAFALSAGLFSLLLYLTLYLQDVLGFSAFQAGIRLIVLSGGIMLTSTLSGRLTAHVPIRFLIAPGLMLVGIGLLLMRGLSAGSGWTHLIPGFIVAGAGTGLINPPLASTAIGVVRPERAGMASGINSTFRQVGISTGIAGLGSIFSHRVRTEITSLLTGAPGMTAGQAHALATSVAQGSGAGRAIASLPPQARPAAGHALHAAFASGLNEVFLVGAILLLVSGVLTLVLIRSKDFEAGAARGGAEAAPGPEQPRSEARRPAPAAAGTANGAGGRVAFEPERGETPTARSRAGNGGHETQRGETPAGAGVHGGAGGHGGASGHAGAAARLGLQLPAVPGPVGGSERHAPSDRRTGGERHGGGAGERHGGGAGEGLHEPAPQASGAGGWRGPGGSHEPGRTAREGAAGPEQPPPSPPPPERGAPPRPSPRRPALPALPLTQHGPRAYRSLGELPPWRPTVGDATQERGPEPPAAQPGPAPEPPEPPVAEPGPAPEPPAAEPGPRQPTAEVPRREPSAEAPPRSAEAPPPAPEAPAHDSGSVREWADTARATEEAALTFAREIGHAREHLVAAADHLENASRARSDLERLSGRLGRFRAGIGLEPDATPGERDRRGGERQGS